MKVRILLEQSGHVEKEYKDMNDFEDNYVNDYLIVKAKHEEAEKEVVKEKLEKISEELIEKMNEEKFENLTEGDRVANCFDIASETRKLQRINRLEKMKYKFTNKLNLNV